MEITKEQFEEAANKVVGLTEENTSLKERLDALENQMKTEREDREAREAEGKVLKEARGIIAELVGAEAFPPMTASRLTKKLASECPMKEGVLDREALTEKVAATIKEEVDYLTEVFGGRNPISGVGGTEEGGEELTDEQVEEALAKSFSALGLNESTAALAAKGRR